MTLDRCREQTYCIIGAGAAGLCAARHARAAGATVTVFEQTAQLGGTWVYTDQVGKDHHGVDIHTSMYADLRTNLVRESMGYPDFPIAEQARSFIDAADVLKSLVDYAEHFEVTKLIQYGKQVMRVTRLFGSNQWEVIVRDVVSDTYRTDCYEFVFVCNGHYSSPVFPDFEGKDSFKGRQLHSREYRRAAHYQDERVLIVGAGYSGIDISIEVAKYASRTVLSHRCKEPVVIAESAAVHQKPEVDRLTANGVQYNDGSSEDFDVIIYCTGYRYSFPFLSTDCGIFVEDNHVQPLYKHCININQPTMAFIGLTFNGCLTQMMDLQVQMCMKFYSGSKAMPSPDQMRAVEALEEQDRRRRGMKKKLSHMLADDLQQRYYDDLAELADTETLKPVLARMHEECIVSKLRDAVGYRNYAFRVVDSETFTKVELSEDLS